MSSCDKNKLTDVSGRQSIEPKTFGMLKAAYSVKETLELLSIGRTSLYALVKSGELNPVKLGRKTLFLAHDLTNFLMRLGGRAAVERQKMQSSEGRR